MARHNHNRGYRHDPQRRDRKGNRELVVAASTGVPSTNGHSDTSTAIALADATAPIVVPMTNKRNPGSSPFVSAAGFAALDNGDKPFPRMPANTPGKPPMEAVGAAGNQIFAGIIAQDAEYNGDFYWRDAIDVYEKMRRNDAQINAVLQMLYLPIERTTWRIKPASEAPIDKEIASFVESCLFHDMLYESTEGRPIRQQWMSILQHILLMLPFGFSVFAKWFRVDDDGWVKWARFEPLLQRTLWRWWIGSDSQLVGIQQRTFKNWRVEFEDIHADRILRFAWRQEGNNYDGWSVLRSAYKHWYYKDGMYKIQAIAVERSATMPPIGTLGPQDLNQAAANAMLSQLQNMRVSDAMGIVLPYGQTIEIPQNHMRGAQEIDSAIAHHDMMLARNVLAQFINLGSTETGAYALADVQTKTFMECEEGVAHYITSVLNTEAIPELVDYNYDNVSIYPLIEFEPLADSDVKDVSLAIQNMASFISNDPGFEDYVRKLVGAPSAPKDMVVATNPTAPDKNAQKPGSAAQETKPAKPGIPENPADEVGDGKQQAASQTAAGLVEQLETRLLNEALYAIYGRDATERGERHMLRLADKGNQADGMCDCSPETYADDCMCAADCECRASGGSCIPTENEASGGDRALSMRYEADIALMERELAETRVQYHLALREESESIQLSNNYPRQSGGKFGFGPGGAPITAGMRTKSKGYEKSIARQESKLQATKDAYAAHLASTGAALTEEEKAAARAGSSGSSSSTSSGFTTPAPVPIAGHWSTYTGNPRADPFESLASFGAHQMRAVLERTTAPRMRQMVRVVQGRNPGTKPRDGRSKAGMTDYIMQYVAPGY